MEPYHAWLFQSYQTSRQKICPRPAQPVHVPCVEGLVSIVLPVFNGEKYLAEALEGIFHQTYRQFELIAINDGSTDHTMEIFERYRNLDERMIVLQQDNQHISRTLSRGFRLAKGEFLTWTSCDNHLKPRFLELMVACLQRHSDWDMINANMDIIGDDGKPLVDSHYYAWYQNPLGSAHVFFPPSQDDLNIASRNNIGAAFMYRARVAYLLGDYSPYRSCVEDYDYWLRVNELLTLRHADFDDIVYEYRFHPGSLFWRAKELRIAEAKDRLMVFDDMRRSSFLEPLTWGMHSDGTAENGKILKILCKELKKRGHVLIDPLSPTVSKFASRWSPFIYIYIGAQTMFNMSSFAKLPENSVKIWLRTDGSLQLNSFSEIFDLIIGHRPQVPREVLPSNKKVLCVLQLEDVLWAADIYARAQAIKCWEMQIYGSEDIPGITIAVTVLDRLQSLSLQQGLSSLIRDISALPIEIILRIHPEEETLPNVRNHDQTCMEEAEAAKIPVRCVICPDQDLNTVKNKLLAEARTETVLFLEPGFNLSMDGIEEVIQTLQNNKDTDALCLSMVGSSGPYHEKLTSILRKVHSRASYSDEWKGRLFDHVTQWPWRPIRAVAVRKRTFWESGAFFSHKSLKGRYFDELSLLIALNRMNDLGCKVQVLVIHQGGKVLNSGISHMDAMTGVLATELWLSYWMHRELLKRPPRSRLIIAEVLEDGIVPQLKSMGVLKACILYARWMMLERQYFKTIQQDDIDLKTLTKKGDDCLSCISRSA
jgi:glycosyltransferase involved in cell wall biosynthesis